jgi:drug/metabolite transporter (DMT)-like permease
MTLHRRIDTTPPRWALAIGSGALSALANLAFLLAVRSGDLSIVAVITALYPGVTVVLARVVLGERLRPVQVAGLATAALAVSLLALG